MKDLQERGVTLIELVTVMAIALLAMTGIVTFYLNAQAVWLDASTQSMMQRDATLIVERMTTEGRVAATAEIVDDPDPLHQMLILRTHEDLERRFFWNPTDSLIHFGASTIPGAAAGDDGPLVPAKVAGIHFEADSRLVYVRNLTMASHPDRPVSISSTIALYNAAGP
jgi:prepilin-type N-terminal cleavage/methylation domain-containing protein